MKVPTVTTNRLVLRPFTEADTHPLHRILSKAAVIRYMPNTIPPPIEKVQKFISHQIAHWQEHGFGWWAVETHSSSGLIGWNGLQYLPETEEIEIGYLLDKPFWGQGLATEGAHVGLSYGFEKIKLDKIIALVHPDNTASQRVILKLGMIFANKARYFGIDVHKYVIKRRDFALGLE